MAVVGAPTFLLLGTLLSALFSMVKSDNTCDIEIENTLKTLLSPQEYPSMQLQALRKDMLRRFQSALDRSDADGDAAYKRSLSSLARWDNLPTKRNLEALARAGLVRTLPAEEEEEPGERRGEPKPAEPNFQINEKRGIQSLARNGELHAPRRELEELLEALHDKRNIGSLARNFDLPGYGKRYLGALARNGDFQRGGKRARGKRQAYFEEAAPVYQGQDVDDYEELMRGLAGAYPDADKRFLGSASRSEWFPPSALLQPPEKRHIGALARLGWLPTLRNVRRFNRSGRSTSADSCREAAPDGQAADDGLAEDAAPLDERRLLLQPPPGDRILLRKMLLLQQHPRTPLFLPDMS